MASARISSVSAVFLCALALFLQGCDKKTESHEFMAHSTTTPSATPAAAGSTKPLVHFDPLPPPLLTTPKPLVNEGCSKDREDCRKSACCYQPDHHCYMKDAFFATCMFNCTPGHVSPFDPPGKRTPWSCAIYHPTVPPPKCARFGQGCKHMQCCGGLTCFEKNVGWSACRHVCKPGIDHGEPKQFQTPWTCRKTVPQPPTTTVTTTTVEAPELILTDVEAGNKPSTTVQMGKSSTYCSKQSVSQGRLNMQGVQGEIWAKGSGGVVYGDSLKLEHNSGYSLMSTCRDAWAPNEFIQLRLQGRSIKFQVDLSQVGCACNLAVYLIAAPALDTSGMPSVGKCESSPYYCDANKVCGQWCPEIDLMEANNAVFQATPHKCDAPTTTGHYSSCDRNGCGKSTKWLKGAYGPGPSFKIDTSKAFEVETSFPLKDGNLTVMVTTLRQQGREVRMESGSCHPGYLASLSNAMATGMSLRITYWGAKAETMAWLDQPPCGSAENCGGRNAGPGVVSGFAVHPPQLEAPLRKIPGYIPLPKPVPFILSGMGSAGSQQLQRPDAHRGGKGKEEPSTTKAPELTVWTAFEQHLWALRGLLVISLFLLSSYLLCVLTFWRYPALAPKPDGEQCCEWLSLSAPSVPKPREDGQAGFPSERTGTPPGGGQATPAGAEEAPREADAEGRTLAMYESSRERTWEESMSRDSESFPEPRGGFVYAVAGTNLMIRRFFRRCGKAICPCSPRNLPTGQHP